MRQTGTSGTHGLCWHTGPVFMKPLSTHHFLSREVQLPIDDMYGLPGQPVNAPLYVKELRKLMSEAYDWVRNHLSSEQRRHKQLYDMKVAGNPFTIGSIVWLHNPVVPRGQSKKLHTFWKCPYTCVNVQGNCVYKIKHDTPPKSAF